MSWRQLKACNRTIIDMQSNEALMLAFGKKTQILHEGLAPTVRTPKIEPPMRLSSSAPTIPVAHVQPTTNLQRTAETAERRYDIPPDTINSGGDVKDSQCNPNPFHPIQL